MIDLGSRMLLAAWFCGTDLARGLGLSRTLDDTG